MKNIEFQTSGVCCKCITFDIDDAGAIRNVRFIKGCPGNQVGIANLIEGQNALDIAEKLKDVTCGAKSTSCPAQLSKAILENI